MHFVKPLQRAYFSCAAESYPELVEKEVCLMNCNEHANKCIACTVSQCSNHCGTSNYCSLDMIQVGTHELDPTKKQCTDCKSFRMK